MATSYKKESFIKRSNLLENKFLDVNSLPRLPVSLYDEDYTIPHQYHERPDLLAFQLYESSRLWWVFALRNLDTIQDPIRDFKAGITIKLPSAETVNNYLGR